MDNRRHGQVVNIDEVAAREDSRGGFGFSYRRLGNEAGGRALGCAHLEVAAGKTAFPFHFHTNCEEALFILEGSGRLRLGDATVEVKAGDYIAFPAGPESAHALTNTAATPLRYLALSSPASPITTDICVYPDSKKVAYGAFPDPAKGFRGGVWVHSRHKEQTPVDYYLDEPLAGEADPGE
jgi:uncharacterized cupin superfamily protein